MTKRSENFSVSFSKNCLDLKNVIVTCKLTSFSNDVIETGSGDILSFIYRTTPDGNCDTEATFSTRSAFIGHNNINITPTEQRIGNIFLRVYWKDVWNIKNFGIKIAVKTILKQFSFLPKHLTRQVVMIRFFAITENAGNALVTLYNNVIHMIYLWSDTIVSLLTVLNPFYKGNKSFQRQVSFQILFTGVEAFWLIGVIALMCGGTVIIQAINNMPNFGVGEYFGKLLKIFVVREIGPIVTFLLVLGRSGTALTAYLGNMRVNKEITALEAMGIQPVDYLVMPTFVGMVLSMMCLNFYFAVIAIVGGLAVAEMTIHIPFMIYLQKAFASISMFDVYFILVKSIISGMVISIVSCFFGLSVNNIREVSMVVIKSFVVSGAIRIVIKVIVMAAFFRMLFPEARAFFG